MTSLIRRLLVAVSLLFFLAAPMAALAQAQNAAGSPSFNALCWLQSDCLNSRALLACKESWQQAQTDKNCDKTAIQGGFISDSSVAPCTGGDPSNPWGRCLPAGSTQTEISFGGKSQFANIGDFIQSNYIYAIAIAGILAVVMIIIAGVQWTVSGGNSEMITSAKKRIGGAIIGLFLAYCSYFVLNTINPALVAFRLPQTWMIRAITVAPNFCSAVTPTTTQFAAVFPASDQKTVTPPAPPSGGYQYNLSYYTTPPTPAPNASGVTPTPAQPQLNSSDYLQQNFACGARLAYAAGGSQLCTGEQCPKLQGCVNLHVNNPADNTFKCDAVSLVGKISNSSFIPASCALSYVGFKGWGFPYVQASDGYDKYYAVCTPDNGAHVELYQIPGPKETAVNGTTQNTQIFSMSPVDPNDTANVDASMCHSKGALMGYALALDINENCNPIDQTHLFDASGNDIGRIQVPSAAGSLLTTVLGGAVAGPVGAAYGAARAAQVYFDGQAFFTQSSVNIDDNALFTSEQLVNGNNIMNIDLGTVNPNQ